MQVATACKRGMWYNLTKWAHQVIETQIRDLNIINLVPDTSTKSFFEVGGRASHLKLFTNVLSLFQY